MSTIDEIMGAIGRHGDDCIRDAEGLRKMIAAALADAERNGAEAMREAAAVACGETYTVPVTHGDVIVEVDRPCYPAGMTASNIRALPLQTGGRQAVLLTDEQIERAVDGHGWTVSELQVEDIPGMARDIEAAVLAANNLGVRRG